MTNFIQTITVENRQVDKENYFTIGYSPEIEKSLLCVYISWIAGYERYYELDDEDLALFESKREEFLKKYEKEIKAYRKDYNFSSLPENILKNLDSYPPFNGYVYQNGIVCAKIKIEDKYFYLLPIYDEDCR